MAEPQGGRRWQSRYAEPVRPELPPPPAYARRGPRLRTHGRGLVWRQGPGWGDRRDQDTQGRV